MVVWVTEGGRGLIERAHLGHSSERRQWAGCWKPSLRGEAGATLGGRALADPIWSLVRQAQGPFSREGRRCGLEGYRGVRGFWPWAGQGSGGVGFLGTRNPGCWGYQRWGGKEPNLNRTHAWSVPSPPPLAWGCPWVKALLPKTRETQWGGDQLGPTRLQI